MDKVEPAIPGLLVEGTGGFGGELVITNSTSMDVFINDPTGHEEFKMTSTEVFCCNTRGNCSPGATPSGDYPPGGPFCEGHPEDFHKGNVTSYGWHPVAYCGSSCGLPTGRYWGQVMREWVLEGRAGDTPFKIYGRTVYEPRGRW